MFKYCFLFLLFLNSTVFGLDLGVMRGKKSPEPASTKNKVDLSRPHAFYVGVSLYSKSILGTTSQGNAKKDYLSPPQYPLSLAYAYRFDDRSRLFAQLDYTILNKKGEDGGTNESDLLLHFPYLRALGNSAWEWKVGLVFHQNKVIGSGGTVTLNNGTGTNNFYLPDRTSTSNSFLFEFGGVYEASAFSYQVEMMIESPLNNPKRNFSLLTGLTYKIGTF